MPLKQDVCGLRGLQPRQVSSPRAWVWCREATSCHSHSSTLGFGLGTSGLPSGSPAKVAAPGVIWRATTSRLDRSCFQ